ncbi:lysosomal alpha-mannosidase-like isoform X2 [Daphnia pulicaria]|uniref:lysosomal alpha-mannosidase-like isoform X2 n=1 Tax=Daphnia pulicaria TaxID=35523 RepID=UPI001EEB7EB0|nr:lysosomal alpha-mannosidase-like isoform X2 [Daphnia pulicaria]
MSNKERRKMDRLVVASISSSLMLLVVAGLVHPSSGGITTTSRSTSCGYQSCHATKPGFINVHLVPHTHDDVGWLKTVDQYYYGSRTGIQKAGVQYILDSVVEELQANPERRFIYVEMAFFWQWWEEQDESTRDVVRDLVSQGRLEFINGGWCMNDEATTHYVDIIDQMSLGLSLLNDTFGECGRPRIAWQIDPFGHSREQAFIFSQMGYDGLFFGRLDHEDKKQRMAAKTMEMVWSSSSLGQTGWLFTGVNYNLYQPPPGFCFDILCSDLPVIDNPKSKEYNVDQRVTEFLNYCQRQSEAYATDHILLTMGGDFTYQDANVWYKNMDKLIKYANERQTNGSRFNLLYSTPSCYVKSLNGVKKSWPLKTDDFFPYGSDAHSYWTGYFTSRPAFKYMVRQGSNLLQACKQMDSALSWSGSTNQGDVNVMKRAMGIAQHHDAVSGTEKQAVVQDYQGRLHEGVVECQKTQASYYQSQLPILGRPLPDVKFCQLNVSQCDVSETSGRFVVNIYNSLARHVDKYVRIPVAGGDSYQVLDPKGKVVDSQLIPISPQVQALPGRTSSATEELVFLAAQLPPIGSKSYYVERDSKHRRRHSFKSKSQRLVPGEDHIITTDKVKVRVDGTTGLLSSVTVNGEEYFVQQEFLWYPGYNGDNESADRRSSGAYIFRPNGTDAFPMRRTMTAAIITAVYTGPLVQEIHQFYDSWVSQVIRIYRGQEHVELDWVVGPVPVSDKIGKEVISRVTTTILQSDGTFYTDSNGRQTLRRELDARESYTYTPTEPVSGNYYPINSHLFIRDPVGEQQATVLVDRSQGGSSLIGGLIELMVHRRLLRDDSFGVDEPLDETAFQQGLVVRGSHYLILSDGPSSAGRYRPLAQQIYKQPQLSFIPTTLTFVDWRRLYKTQQQLISRELPENVNLLTLENRSDGSYLIRLEHIYDVGEDKVLSEPVTVSLKDLFPGFAITSAEETILGGNQLKKDSQRLVWHSSSDKQTNVRSSHSDEFPDLDLQPMEIRTFILNLVRDNRLDK